MKTLWSLVSLAAINLFFIWIGLQLTIAEGLDGKERIKTTLLLISAIANILATQNFKYRINQKNAALLIWLIWLIYSIINTLFQYSPTSKSSTLLFITVELILPFILMVAVSSITPERVPLLLNSLQYSLCFFLVLMAISTGLTGSRLSLERFDPNELSLYLFALISIVSINYFLEFQSFLTSFAILILVLLLSVFLGSRMGFSGCLLLVAGFFYVTKKSLISVKRLLITAPIAVVILMYVINETALGERILGTANQTETLEYNPAEGTIFEYYGDRGLYYVIGWEAFKDSPIFGIGLNNFIHNYYRTVMHPEIMIQLTELGLVGISLHILFLFRIFFGINRQLKGNYKIAPALKYLIYPFFVLIYSSTVLFLYNSFAVALLHGIMILFLRVDIVYYLSSINSKIQKKQKF